MKHIVLFTTLIFSITIFSQSERQSFCGGDPEAPYFTLHSGTKHIVWDNSFYSEKNVGIKTINGVEYTHYKQSWKSGSVQDMYLREENGNVFQFEDCCEDDTVRLPVKQDIGESWQTADKLSTYEIISIDGELETPVCKYTNLLVLKSTFKNGAFTFYYQKGYGYIGATVNDQLISFVIPRLPKD